MSTQTTRAESDVSLPCICILLMGSAESAEHVIGMFVTRLGPNVSYEAVRVAADEKPKRKLEEYAGVIVTGSRSMVTENLPWSIATGKILREIIEQDKVPMLAVCYGHQLIAQEFGEKVDFIEKKQMGMRECTVHEALKTDPLFSCFADRSSLQFLVAHQQSALGLPARATLLISSQVDPHYACRWGPRQWSTQFHPEFRPELIAKLAETKRDLFEKEGYDVDVIISEMKLEEDGAPVLARFAQLSAAHAATIAASNSTPVSELTIATLSLNATEIDANRVIDACVEAS